jgi:hypothetical protein
VSVNSPGHPFLQLLENLLERFAAQFHAQFDITGSEARPHPALWVSRLAAADFPSTVILGDAAGVFARKKLLAGPGI